MRWLGLVLWLSSAAVGAQDFNTDVHTVPAPQNAARAEANAALEARDYEKALRLLRPMAVTSPKDARLLYDLGSAQDALDQGSAAVTSYRAAIEDDGLFLEPRVALGLLLARGGKLAEARVELVGAVGVPSENNALRARAFRALARIDEKARPADARDELLEALKLTPETPDDTMMSAELAQAAGNGGPAAEAAYRRLLLVHPDDAQASAALAHLLQTSGRAPEAEALLKTALAAHPGETGLTAQLAAVYSAEGKVGEALPLVEALHREQPKDAAISRLLGELYLDDKNYAAGEPLLARLSAANPDDGVLADEWADTLIHLKRFAEAEQGLARVVGRPELFPNKPALGDAAGHLAFAASENNDPATSLRALAVRATVLPPSAPALFLQAISYDKLHQVKLAQQAYKDFLGASNGALPDEEFEAQHRLVALKTMK